MKRRIPNWLKQPLGPSPSAMKTSLVLDESGLCTVCEEAACPNRAECYGQRTATFMILGAVCTRNCRYCNVSSGTPALPDPDEPSKVAEAVSRLGLRYVVVTSVTRDDLNDKGAAQFAKVIGALKGLPSKPRIEILTPDFLGSPESVARVIEARPDVWGHNIEVVPRLFPFMRPGADYHLSLDLLRRVKAEAPHIVTKSSLMIGLGETVQEILEACRDLRDAETDLVVIGQYLSPTSNHTPVERFYTPQ
ncbi:MAG TPA: lipoyl synthase, partial [bacterium]|nr:lipoyl synthase [bacterium]